MKFLKLLPILCGCVAAVSFTSCNPEEEAKNLTPEQKKTAFMAVKGSYSGDFIYLDPKSANKPDKTDTVSVNWEIDTDSTLTIKNFPAAPLAAHITDAKLAEAMAAQPAQPLKCRIGFYSVTPVGFLINPISAEYQVTYNGGSHKVQVGFYVNNPYSYGAYNSMSKQMKMQIVVGGIFLDGKFQKTLLKKAVPFGIETKKVTEKKPKK